jgi:hypothetical protein
MPTTAAAATLLQTPAAHPFGLFVNGMDVIRPHGTDLSGVPIESIRITEGGDNASGSLQFLFEDPLKAYSLPTAAEVIFWDFTADVPLFAGFLVGRELVPSFGQTARSVRVSCTDYSPLLDAQLLPEGALPAGISDLTMLQAILSSHGGRLKGDPTTIANTNASMPALSFIGLTLRQAIEKVADAAGTNRVYWVDSLSRLNYTSASSLVAPYVISDAPSGAQRAANDLTLSYEDVITNAVYVRGGNTAGSGWVLDTDSIRDVGQKFEAYLDQPDSDTAAKRNLYGAAYLGRVKSAVVRGSFGTDTNGWRPGQIVTITNAALGLTSATYQVVSVETEMLSGTGYRYSQIAFGALPKSLARLLGQR